jgi:Fur family transcriptional regulator, peroxide stress response regulator
VIPSRQLLERHGLRCTRQRTALYDTLRACVTHPTAEELFVKATERSSGLSRATVYNTLEALCDAGLARRLDTDSGVSRYDADTTEHLHVRMRGTSEVLDVPPDLGDRLIREVPRDVINEIEGVLGVKIDGMSIQLLARPASG